MSTNKIFLLAHKLLHPFVVWLRSRPFALKLLFGIRIPQNFKIHYDTTTVLFRDALIKEIAAKDKVLEMGIGQAALLSLFLYKKKENYPKGVDLSPERVESSNKVAMYNNIKAKFWESDLFSTVIEKYDVIFFNPPYVTTEAGEKLKLSKKLELESDAVWNGGVEGTDVIKRFIETAASSLTDHGKLLIGVQDMYITEKAMGKFAEAAGYEITNSYHRPLNPSRIYILKRN